jgi:hypothetical protein
VPNSGLSASGLKRIASGIRLYSYAMSVEVKKCHQNKIEEKERFKKICIS